MDEQKVTQQVLDWAADALKVSKIHLMMGKNTTFYTTILFSLKQIMDIDIPTACTDGRELRVNPQFFIDLTGPQRIGLLIHEVLHVALDHMHRRMARDPRLWNIAADYVINGHLLKAGYELPDGCLYDKDYDGLSTEQVYDILDKKSEDQKAVIYSAAGKDPLGGDVQYPENAEPGKEVTQEEVTKTILRAQTQAQAMGQPPGAVPGEIDISLQKTLNPPLPWNVILQNYLFDFAKDDYSWRKANRRYMPQHYLPTPYSESIPNIACIVDASGSVRAHSFNDYITKMGQLMDMMKPKKITSVAFDTRIHEVIEWNEWDNPFEKLKFTGRGGTQINCVYDWLNENKPTLAIIFTDGHFKQIPPIDRNIPIIWLIEDNEKWKCQSGNRVIHFNPGDPN